MPLKTIFIFAYYSYKDPVFQSAVLPYFLNFPDKEKFKFVLLTFEQKEFELSEDECVTVASYLESYNIMWHKRTWHSGRFKFVKKAYDFVTSLFVSISLILKYKADFIYSEGFPGAIITHFLSGLTGRKHIVHTFEPHADYMIESGVWNEASWEAKLIKSMQDRIAKKAFAILTATQAMIDIYKEKCPRTRFYRVPSCVDLDLFRFDIEARNTLRTKFDIGEHQTLMVYLGKLDGMYWEQELFDFFAVMESSTQIDFKFLIITREDKAKYEHLLNEKMIWLSASREEVPKLLSAADVAVCGIRNIPSRRFSSPIKNGEYWAMGLKTVIPVGISDDYLFAEQEKIGWILPTVDDNGYRKVLSELEQDLDLKQKSARARNFVEKDRSITVYQDLYKDIFSK